MSERCHRPFHALLALTAASACAAAEVHVDNRIISASAWPAEAEQELAPLRDRVGPQELWRERWEPSW